MTRRIPGYPGAGKNAGKIRKWVPAGGDETDWKSGSPEQLTAVLQPCHGPRLRATQLNSGTCVKNVVRVSDIVHLSPGWPAVAGHDTVGVNIQSLRSYPGAGKKAGKIRKRSSAGSDETDWKSGPLKQLTAVLQPCHGPQMRATQLNSGTCVKNVVRVSGIVHLSPGWPAVAGHDTVGMNIRPPELPWCREKRRERFFSAMRLGPLRVGHPTRVKQGAGQKLYVHALVYEVRSPDFHSRYQSSQPQKAIPKRIATGSHQLDFAKICFKVSGVLAPCSRRIPLNLPAWFADMVNPEVTTGTTRAVPGPFPSRRAAWRPALRLSPSHAPCAVAGRCAGRSCAGYSRCPVPSGPPACASGRPTAERPPEGQEAALPRHRFPPSWRGRDIAGRARPAFLRGFSGTPDLLIPKFERRNAGL